MARQVDVTGGIWRPEQEQAAAEASRQLALPATMALILDMPGAGRRLQTGRDRLDRQRGGLAGFHAYPTNPFPGPAANPGNVLILALAIASARAHFVTFLFTDLSSRSLPGRWSAYSLLAPRST